MQDVMDDQADHIDIGFARPELENKLTYAV